MQGDLGFAVHVDCMCLSFLHLYLLVFARFLACICLLVFFCPVFVALDSYFRVQYV